MTSPLDLKDWLHRDLKKADKLLIILASLGGVHQVKEIKGCAKQAGFRVPNNWNVSSVLNAAIGLAIRTEKGWEITKKGKDYLLSEGVPLNNIQSFETAHELRNLLRKISNADTRGFVEEAIICTEHSLHRSAVVMAWLAAIHILRVKVFSGHLSDFNSEARKVNPKWKPAKTEDDLSVMKESDFLDRLVAISLIGTDVKKQLRQCLELRNSCGHPNSLKIEQLKVASHIETLILNVFSKFI